MSAQDLAAQLRDGETKISETIRAGGPFVVRGNGTSRIGLAEGETLSTIALSGVTLYEPGSLTLVAQAGTPLSHIEALLAQNAQRLAFEPPDLRALLGRTGEGTIGGLVARNASGPRRVSVGACRDFCLGVRYVNGSGDIVKNGGRVMKNVTGYDLVKLMAGSHGTLGVLTEVSLKTQPVPEITATLVIDDLSEQQAVAAMAAALGTPFDVTGAAHVRPDGSGAPARTLIRLEGFEASVRYRAAELQKALATFGDVSVVWEAAANQEIWNGVRDVTRFADVAGDVWHVSVKPSDAPALVEAVSPLDVIYDWGGGRLWLLTPEGTDVRGHMGAGHATLVRASDETKMRLGTFHPESDIVARLTGGLRKAFDPMQKLNRGMMG